MLDQCERLQHRVVDSRRHVGSFLGTDSGLALVDEVTADPHPPRSQHDHHRGDHQCDAREWTEQRRARVSEEQRGHATDQEHARDQGAQRHPRSPGVAGEADEGIGETPQCHLLGNRSVSRDQDNCNDADHDRPGDRADPVGADQRHHHEHGDEQRRQSGGERDPRLVCERRAADVRPFPGGRYQEPGDQVAGDAESTGERKEHEDGSYDGDVDAGPRRHPGGDATEPALLGDATPRTLASLGPGLLCHVAILGLARRQGYWGTP